MSNSLIRLENVTKTFPVRTQDVLVLKSINVGIEKGDFVVIFGPSGCGKSTLLHTVLGLEPPTLGRVLYSDNDILVVQDTTMTLRQQRIMQ
jgi:ABC-type sugar transport system ATPase subunit